MSRKLIKSVFWKMFYSRWNAPVDQLEPGYTLLLMVPGDLPVFLRLAMEVCRRQDPAHLVETLVIPDKLSDGLMDRWRDLRREWPHGSIRLVQLGWLDRQLTNRRNDPHINCWLQVIRGIEQARSTYALWHDADLFITNRSMLRDLYEHASANNMAFWGIDPQSPIFREWYYQRGIRHIVASYEMMMDVAWFRSFKPWEHRRHVVIDGDVHQVDITYYSQVRTPPQRNGWKRRPDGFIHFSYVIGTYRWFQQAFRKGQPFADKAFKLLLVRLLVDAFDSTDWPYEVPTAEVMAKGLTDASQPVTFLDEQNHEWYPRFRKKLAELLHCDVMDETRRLAVAERIRPFDKHFCWTAPDI